MKKQLSPAQQQQRDERKARFAQLVKQVAGMSVVEKAELASKILVTNVDGHTLSVRNQILIALQIGCHATIVGGFRQWIKQGRCVRKGEHGASILFPRTFGEKEGGDITRAEWAGEQTANVRDKIYFLSGTVFDVSQTDEIAGQVSETVNEAIVEHAGNLTLV